MPNSNTVQERINENAALYGNKAANLIELDSLCKKFENKKININIPEIFPINDQNIQHHLDSYAKDWRALWDAFIKAQINQKALTEEGKLILKRLRDCIIDCFHQYPFNPDSINKDMFSPDALFMVRSSGDEDRVEIANPGGNKSVAAVKLDKSSISNAIGTVVASYFSEKSLTQRLLSGDKINQAFMPVLIQKMIGEKLNGFDHPKQQVISGVMYAKQSGITRLDAAFGHGEIIVNSKAPFDTFEVTNDGIVHAAIHHKKNRLVPTEIKDENNEVARKLIFKENPKKLQSTPSIAPEVASEIANVGRHIANHYGMPMDIEWVFTPETQTLSIVQARPIPQGVKNKLSPSTIAPDQWKKLKNDPDVQLSKTPVISPAGNVAKIVKSETTILSGNIASALNAYLKKSEQKHVDAVVVKEPAPSTSHEAAQFNLMGVPVYQGAVESIERWLKEDKAVVVADTQHQYFVNMTNINKKRKIDDEKTLRDEKTIVDGMYTSTLSTSKTLLPGYMTENDVIKDKIKQYLSNNQNLYLVPRGADTIYQLLIDRIEIIESVKINNKNIEAFNALQEIADIFKVMATSSKGHDKMEPHQKLFVYAMLSIAEIDHCLSEFSQLTALNDQQKLKQQELLDLISKLKALVINPGEPNLYSDSIYQLAVQAKTLKESKVDTSKLNSSQRSYFIEFVKLKALVLNEDTQRIWTEFAYDCAKTPVARQMLSQIIMFAVENNMVSELVNNLFMNAFKNKKNNEKVIANLYEMIDNNKNEFKQYHINENHHLLSAWENRINDWSNPKKFEKLFKEFNLELNPLISSLTLEDKMSNLTQQIILKQAERLTEVIDKSIKTMKGSVEYQGQETLLVERFSTLLVYYSKLMLKWMRALPVTFYDECAAKIRTDMKYNDKFAMLSAIYNGFCEATLKSNLNPSQLNASGYLNVASAKVGSNASFERQFVQQRYNFTLEDYFSLFHQNILASIAELNKTSMPSCDDLPKLIQPLVDEIQKANNVHLLHVTHRHPIIELEFNVPLDNHSAKFILEFNTKTNSLVINGKFFGRNWNSRMDLIAKMAEIEGLLVGDLLQKPSYNEANRSLEFNWQINSDRISHVAAHIKDIVNHYAAMTETAYSSIRWNCQKLWERYYVGSNISTDLLQYLSSENRQQIGEALFDIDRDMIMGTVLKNPEMFPSLIKNITSLTIFVHMSSLDFLSLEKLIDRFGLKIDLAEKNGQTLLEKLITTWKADEALQFLAKYQPDLTLHPAIMNNARNGKCDAKVFEYLFSHDASFNYDDIKYAFRFPDIKQYAIKEMEKWDSTKLSGWIYTRATRAKDDISDRVLIWRIIDQFGDKVNFNYEVASETLFERLAESSCFTHLTTVTELNDFMVKYKGYLSEHPKALNTLLLHAHSTGLFVLKKFIEEHVLDPNVLQHLADGEITSLLSPWSAHELKSWLDDHAGKIVESKLTEITRIYLSKSIHALDPTLPALNRLDVRQVFSCFNNPKLKAQVVDLFKRLNGDEIALWLMDSVYNLNVESFPGFLEFIDLTHANINKIIQKYGAHRFSLFDFIIPFFNDEMAKQDIEKFLNDHQFDITQSPTAFDHTVSSGKHYRLADILVDKGASILGLGHSVVTQDKKLQPIILKAFMKLTVGQRSEFLCNYTAYSELYVQLLESSMKDLNFQYYSSRTGETLFEHSIRHLDDAKLVSMVKTGLVDLSKHEGAVLIAFANKKSDLVQVVLESKAHNLTGGDLAVLDVFYPKDKILSLFKNWSQQELQQWLTANLSDVPEYLNQPILELYRTRFPGAGPIVIPEKVKVNLDSLEDMLKYCFRNTVLSERIQHISIWHMLDVQTFVEFKDNDIPLSKEQKDCIYNFFKQLNLEDWQIKSEDAYREFGRGPRMDIWTSGKGILSELLRKYITKQSSSPLLQGSMFKSTNVNNELIEQQNVLPSMKI